MNSRVPLLGAIGLVLLAVLFAFWSTGDESSRPEQRVGGLKREAGSGPVSVAKNHVIPGRLAPADEHAPPADPPAGPGAGEAGATPGAQSEAHTRAALRRRARQDAVAHRTEVAGRPQAAASEQGVEVSEGEVGGGGGVPENPPPTFEPGSIYDGLSQDDLVELMVALRRLRDAGVFHTLTPEQYYDVQQLMPDRKGIRDADEITQEILGMSVGEWLAHERGPKGRFVLQ